MHPEKLLEPAAAGRASFRSIACAPYKPTKRFYLFFLFPSTRARRSFVVSANRQRSPFVYLHGTRLVPSPYIFVRIRVCIAYNTGRGSLIQETTRAALVLLLHSRVAGTRDITIFRIYRAMRTVLGCGTVAIVNSTWNTVGTTILFSAVCNAG